MIRRPVRDLSWQQEEGPNAARRLLPGTNALAVPYRRASAVLRVQSGYARALTRAHTARDCHEPQWQQRTGHHTGVHHGRHLSTTTNTRRQQR
jgi:hypothetical protein